MAIVASLTALLKLDTKGFSTGIKGAIKSVRMFNRRLSFAARDLQTAGANITALSAPLAIFGVSSVKAAAKAEENANKINVIFSNMRDKAGASIKAFAKDFKLAESEATKLIGTVGDLLTGFDFTQQEALELSDKVNRLAADLTSFNPGIDSVADASERLTKGLLGQTRAMLGLRIAIRQDTAEFKALVRGIQEARGLTLQQAKSLAILDIATRQSKNAIGDFNRTQNSFINLLRRTTQRIIDLKIEVGRFLIDGLRMDEVLLKIVNKLREFTAFIKTLSPKLKRFISLFALSVVVVGPLLLVLGSIGLAITGVISGITALVAVVKLLFTPIGLVVAAVVGLGVALIKIFKIDVKKLLLSFVGFLVNIKANWQILTTFIKELWENIWTSGFAVLKDVLNKTIENMRIGMNKLGVIIGATMRFITDNWDVLFHNVIIKIVDFTIDAIKAFFKIGKKVAEALFKGFNFFFSGSDETSLVSQLVDGLTKGFEKKPAKTLKATIRAALKDTKDFVSIFDKVSTLIPGFAGFITDLGMASVDLNDASKNMKDAANTARATALIQARRGTVAGLRRGTVEAFRIRAGTETKAAKETATNTKETTETLEEIKETGVPIKNVIKAQFIGTTMTA